MSDKTFNIIEVKKTFKILVTVSTKTLLSVSATQTEREGRFTLCFADCECRMASTCLGSVDSELEP